MIDSILAIVAALSVALCNIAAKPNPVFGTPVEQAVKGIPKLAAAALEMGGDRALMLAMK
ncbi:MAG: hypothetical protein HKN82_11785 [Akkermansiaceae bacterium]|nr:hypothetical protein [Akkermansiaceae bacterium]NNM31171.1 hypothetical protein [Akkermansiaceae bacterium]